MSGWVGGWVVSDTESASEGRERNRDPVSPAKTKGGRVRERDRER